ncbi:MAG: sulfoxide reductase heme-binding subunit YedZ, partial [Betaproteobacteria bacterium]|nr:sulfoxide reductase heme-binding subunit YedZ [Betaproteobacteria bacterium]
MPKTLTLLLASLPFARWVYLIATDQLGANPVEFLTRSSGTWTLVLLAATLSMTPMHRLSGSTQWVAQRQSLGLFCFFYGSLHALCWAWFDQGLEPDLMADDLITRPFIAFGMAGWLILLVLAATSHRRAKRRLGRRWKTLHRSIYLLAIAVVLHYLWHKAGKNDFSEAGPWSALLIGLLLFRLPLARVRQWFRA